MQNKKLSIIVSTLGRVSLLPMMESIKSKNIECQEIELIVVHQCPNKSLFDLKKEIKSSPVDTIYIEDQGTGSSRGRNIGLVQAKGEILTFADDDCWYGKGVLDFVYSFMDRNYFVDVLSVYANDDKNTGMIANLSPYSGRVTRENVFKTAIEFALFFKRDVFFDLGFRFNEKMGVGSGGLVGADEGPDLILRILSKGCTVYYSPVVTVYHPSPFNQEKNILERGYKYSFARSVLIREHGLPWRHLVVPLFKNIIAFLLYSMSLNFGKAGYYFNSILGRVHGLFFRLEEK